MTIGGYITVGRRLIFRNLAHSSKGYRKRPAERCMLTRIARFWLCVARWQHLQTLKPGVWVKGANRSTRIEELAVDLRVPVEVVRPYKNSNGAIMTTIPRLRMICESPNAKEIIDFPKNGTASET